MNKNLASEETKYTTSELPNSNQVILASLCLYYLFGAK
jgi:hypothetical protein